MHLLSIDFGTKRIGLAWADTALGMVLPFGLLEEANMAQNLLKLAQLITIEKIDLVVVGLPLGLNGKENSNTTRVRGFAAELKTAITAKLVFYDERFSSQAADSVGGDVSRDEKAAMSILQDYIEQQKRKI